MDWPELAFAILRVIRYWSPGPSRERSVGCSASKRRNSCPCGSVEVERLMIVSSRCARWLPAASEPTRCCQSLPLATTAAALCHHRCNCLPRGKRASHGARWREQVRKARTPTPYTLYAAALGATARGMLCSHTVPHRFAFRDHVTLPRHIFRGARRERCKLAPNRTDSHRYVSFLPSSETKKPHSTASKRRVFRGNPLLLVRATKSGS